MKRLLLAPLIALLGLASAVHAAPLDNRIPKDALLYMGWRGSESLASQYAASNLKGIVDSAGLPDYIRQQLPHWIDLATEKDPEAPEQINDLLKALDIAWRHPAAVYVGPPEFPIGNAPPKPRFAELCDAGPDAPALVALMHKYIDKNPPPPDANLQITQQGSVVILSVGLSKPEDFAVHAGALDTAPVYARALKHIRPDSALTFFADPHAILNTIHEGITKFKDAPPDAEQKFNAIVKALGLSSLGEVVYGGGFDKKEWVEDAFVAINGPRTGALTLLDPGPLDESDLAAVPADAVSFNAGRIDAMKILNTARDIIKEIDPNSLQMFNQGLDAVGHQLGFDVEKDFLATLGDQWIYYRAPSPDGIGLSQALVHKLKDGDTFAKTLKIIEDQVTDRAQGKVTIDTSDVDGISVTQVHFSMVNAALTVRNGYLYVSTVTGISAAVNQVEKKQPSILTNAAYLAARTTLPKVAASSLDYADPSKIYPELYRSAAMVLPLLGAAGFNVPVQILPNPAKSAPFLTPGASEFWTDAAGVHFASRTALPGAGMVSGQQSGSVAAVAFGVGVALPTLGKARELSNRSADGANARGLAQSCNVWAADHNDHLPDHLSQLLAANYISPRQLVTRRSGTKPLDYTPELAGKAKADPASIAQAVDEHCDFIYLGEGIVNQTDSSIVLLFEKPSRFTVDGLTIGFEDGHAEFVRFPALAETFKATNAMLVKNNKPEVDVDALLKAAPGHH